MNIDLQEQQKVKTMAIYWLRLMAQASEPGMVVPNLRQGVCMNLSILLNKDSCYPFELQEALFCALGFETGTNHREYPLSRMANVVGWLSTGWPLFSGDTNHPIPGGADGYWHNERRRTFWCGDQMVYRRQLCNWVADRIERED